MDRIRTITQYRRELGKLRSKPYDFAGRNCGEGGTGITFGGPMTGKIFRCDTHGFICPFDDWQFETIEDLQKHLDNQTQFAWAGDSKLKYGHKVCEGIFRYGISAVEWAKFEIFVYRLEQRVGKDIFYEVYFGVKPEPSLEKKAVASATQGEKGLIDNQPSPEPETAKESVVNKKT